MRLFCNKIAQTKMRRECAKTGSLTGEIYVMACVFFQLMMTDDLRATSGLFNNKGCLLSHDFHEEIVCQERFYFCILLIHTQWYMMCIINNS